MTRPHSFLYCCFGLLLQLLRSNPFHRYCSCLLLPGAGQMTTYLTLAHFWPGVRKLLLTQTCSSGLPPLLMALFSPHPVPVLRDMLAGMTVGVNFCICVVLRRGCLLGSALSCMVPPFSLCWGFRCVFRYEKKKSVVRVCVRLFGSHCSSYIVREFCWAFEFFHLCCDLGCACDFFLHLFFHYSSTCQTPCYQCKLCPIDSWG